MDQCQLPVTVVEGLQTNYSRPYIFFLISYLMYIVCKLQMADVGNAGGDGMRWEGIIVMDERSR